METGKKSSCGRGLLKVLLAIGLVFIIIGTILLVHKQHQAKEWTKTTGVVTGVEECKVGGKTGCLVHFDCDIDGDGEKTNYSLIMRESEPNVGDEITVYYLQKTGETHVCTEESLSRKNVLPPILLGVGALAVIAGAVGNVAVARKSKNAENGAD